MKQRSFSLNTNENKTFPLIFIQKNENKRDKNCFNCMKLNLQSLCLHVHVHFMCVFCWNYGKSCAYFSGSVKVREFPRNLSHNEIMEIFPHSRASIIPDLRFLMRFFLLNQKKNFPRGFQFNRLWKLFLFSLNERKTSKSRIILIKYVCTQILHHKESRMMLRRETFEG